MITVIAKLEFGDEYDCKIWFEHTADDCLSCEVLECD